MNVPLQDQVRRLRAGDVSTLDQVFPLVYEELRRMARRLLRRNSSSETLNTTALVHEAYLKLSKRAARPLERPSDLMALSCTVMRALIVDAVRAKMAKKRGGDWLKVTFPVDLAIESSLPIDVLQSNHSLEQLSQVNERLVQLVECRVFGGLDHRETAAALGISERTAKRDWAKARALLLTFMKP